MTRAATAFEHADHERDLRKHEPRPSDPRVRALLIPGMCAYCDANRADQMMPPHDASPRCESGKRAHCTCDTCF
jgi:hypothetical protein